ncbi:uncharacterized protein LOC132564844 [Ylistrum balloti]|uniref:uncharacterized protein LOC132564844 n=1 Tax=Ylistrum balloti TaxID=509963 RepID=UPI0029057F16|nr:uncharacterized protein LOC132564844 [Ylistrum balloti]
MASKQPDDKGPRTNTNQDKNHIPRGTLENPMSPFQRSNISKNGQTRGRHNDELEYDAVMDSGPTTHSQAYEFQDQIPNLVDVVVIYSNEDFDLVKTKFVPWLTDLAREAEDILSDPTIHLYDDYDIFPQVNVHRQTEEVSAKCMKILVFITDNLMKNEKLKHLVEELIELTKFMDKDEARNHIAKISGLTSNQKIVEYLFDCILRQRGNAIIPVQTKAEKIGFTGLRSIRSIQFYDLTENPRFKEYVATGVIKAAIKERKLQKNVVGHMKRSQNRDINDCPNNSSRKQAHATTVHKNRNQNQGSAARVISNSASDNPVENQLNNEAILSTGPSNDRITGPSTDRITGPSPDRITGPSTDRTSGPSTDRTTGPSTDRITGSSSDHITGASTDRITGSSSDHITGASTDRITGPSTDHFTRPSTSSDVPANQTNGIQSDVPHPSEVWKKETEEVNTAVISEEIPADGATAASSNENTIHDDSLETDRVKSAMDKSEDGKIISSKLSESEESKSENDSAETSLDNTGLVNDSGDAALRSTDLDPSKEESMLNVDAANVVRESSIKKVMMKDTTDSKRLPQMVGSSATVDFSGQTSSAKTCLGCMETGNTTTSGSTRGLWSEQVSGPKEYSQPTDQGSKVVPSNENINRKPHVEIDETESAKENEGIMAISSKLIESGYGSLYGQNQLLQADELKPEKDSGETSLDHTGLVNDFGDASLRRTNQDLSNTANMLNMENGGEETHQTDNEHHPCFSQGQVPLPIEDQSWQAKAEAQLEPSLELESLCASGNEIFSTEIYRRTSTPAQTVETPNKVVSTETATTIVHNESLTEAVYSVTSSSAETGTVYNEYRHAEWQIRVGGQWLSAFGQETSLFVSNFFQNRQFNLNVLRGSLKTNPVGMMSLCPVLSQIERIEDYSQDGDID